MVKALKKAPVTVEPISLDMARLHLRIDVDGGGTSDEDVLIESLISAARDTVERLTGLSLVRRQHIMSLDEFGHESFIDLGTWPVDQIQMVEYRSPEGVLTTMPDFEYILDDFSQPARVHLNRNGWPATRALPNAVQIWFSAGFDDIVNPLPSSLIQAMLLIVGHLFENRQEVVTGAVVQIPMGVEALIQPHRIDMGM